MSIDLSKARVGDKFRTRDGHIMVYTSYEGYILGSGRGEYVLTTEEEFPVGDGLEKLSFYYFSDGTGNDGLPFDASNVLQSLQEKIPIRVPYGYELVEQVFDDEKDIMNLEIDERRNREMQKFVEDAKDENQELQRRQEVVELAEMIFFSDRGNKYSFKECVEVAEHSVNIRNQYLKEGKLC
jgi:hypothetical protein